MSSSTRTLYVGNLPGDIREREVEDLFNKYGQIARIDLKVPPRGRVYAFVEFNEARDAEDAIRGRDGYDFDRYRLRVELAHGGRGNSSFTDRYNSHGISRGGGGDGSSRGEVSRRSDYKVLVTGLPSSASWQELKDHMRQGGDVSYSQVFKQDGGIKGIVHYTNYDDMKYAIKYLNDSEFRNAVSHGAICVEDYDSSCSRSRMRCRSRSSSRSFSRSPSKSRRKSLKAKSSRRSKSRSKSASPRPSARQSQSQSDYKRKRDLYEQSDLQVSRGIRDLCEKQSGQPTVSALAKPVAEKSKPARTERALGVISFLQALHLEKYITTFEGEEIYTMRILRHLSDHELKLIGIKELSERVKIREALEAIDRDASTNRPWYESIRTFRS